MALTTSPLLIVTDHPDADRLSRFAPSAVQMIIAHWADFQNDDLLRTLDRYGCRGLVLDCSDPRTVRRVLSLKASLAELIDRCSLETVVYFRSYQSSDDELVGWVNSLSSSAIISHLPRHGAVRFFLLHLAMGYVDMTVTELIRVISHQVIFNNPESSAVLGMESHMKNPSFTSSHRLKIPTALYKNSLKDDIFIRLLPDDSTFVTHKVCSGESTSVALNHLDDSYYTLANPTPRLLKWDPIDKAFVPDEPSLTIVSCQKPAEGDKVPATDSVSSLKQEIAEPKNVESSKVAVAPEKLELPKAIPSPNKLELPETTTEKVEFLHEIPSPKTIVPDAPSPRDGIHLETFYVCYVGEVEEFPGHIHWSSGMMSPVVPNHYLHMCKGSTPILFTKVINTITSRFYKFVKNDDGKSWLVPGLGLRVTLH